MALISMLQGAHKTTPQVSDMTAGFKFAYCTDGSSIIGIRPTNVVIEVITIGLNLTTPASITASRKVFSTSSYSVI